MVTPAPTRPSRGALVAKLGPAGVKVSLTLALLYGALHLSDRTMELERRERALQGRAATLAQREAVNDARERGLREAIGRLERAELAARPPLPEPLPLEDAVVIRAGNHPEPLPVAGH